MTAITGSQRWHRTLGVLFAALLVLAAPAMTSAEEPTDRALAEALRFRETFALNSDPTFVRDMASKEPTEPWSTALTPDETAEMDRRVAIQNGLADLHAYGGENADVFGGIWIDQSAGGIVEVQFTDDPNRHAAAVRDLVPAGAEIRLRQVENTIVELEQLTERISNDRSFISSLGADVHQAGPDVRTNRVALDVSALSEELEAALITRYGKDKLDVAVTQAPRLTGCSNRDNCIGPPLRGGIYGTNYGCTVGFMSREDGWNRFMTAGHCGNVGGATWWHNNSGWPIGDMKDDEFYNGSYADAATVGNISPTYMSNWVYWTASSSSLVLSKEGFNADTVGQTVCQSGRTSGFTCGELYAKGFWITYGSVTLYDQRSATYNVALHDSGAPVLAANKAMGIQSGENSAGRAIYSHIYRVEAALGASVYLGD